MPWGSNTWAGSSLRHPSLQPYVWPDSSVYGKCSRRSFPAWQAALLERILPLLTQEEAQVLKRGRNASPHSYPKGATRQEYLAATGLETLFGWLYLRGETDRLNTLFETMMEGEG